MIKVALNLYTSWKLECIKRVARMERVAEMVSDQCQFGHETTEGEPVKKGTRWMSNSEWILEAQRGVGGSCCWTVGEPLMGEPLT